MFLKEYLALGLLPFSYLPNVHVPLVFNQNLLNFLVFNLLDEVQECSFF